MSWSSRVSWPSIKKARTTRKDDDGDRLLPDIDEGDVINLDVLRPEQHFTEPPPRFTEASLVKTLEEYGIGRPSTYASIIATLKNREYVEMDGKRFYPDRHRPHRQSAF